MYTCCFDDAVACQVTRSVDVVQVCAICVNQFTAFVAADLPLSRFSSNNATGHALTRLAAVECSEGQQRLYNKLTLRHDDWQRCGNVLV